MLIWLLGMTPLRNRGARVEYFFVALHDAGVGLLQAVAWEVWRVSASGEGCMCTRSGARSMENTVYAL